MKKLAIYFLIAILLPVLVLAYLGYNTFAKRREAVKNLLTSSLWVSTEAALRSIENELLEEENKALRPANFSRLVESQGADEVLKLYSFRGSRIRGKLFLLNSSFQILFPRTAGEPPAFFPWPTGSAASPFQNNLARAENFEFAEKDYSQAAEFYRKSASLASSPREQGIALEGLGRSLFLSKKYSAASDVYGELAAGCGMEEDRAGHPFAIIARLRLSEIERQRGKDESCAKILLELFQKMRNGAWPVSQTSYEFFASEIRSRLTELKSQGRQADIQASFEALWSQPSPYLEAVIFTDWLRREVVTEVRKRTTPLLTNGSSQTGRLVAGLGKETSLVSFCILPDFQNQGTCFGGFYWEPDSLKKEGFLRMLDTVSRDSGLRLWLIDEAGRDVVAAEEKTVSTSSVSLSFDRFPFPWKLVASQPARSDLERAVRRENIIYGILLIVVLTLMLLGAILILRDISREKETTRQRAEFVNTISHEFKTPLTLIRLYSETLERHEDLTREQKEEAYEIITKEAERLTHMINNVLDFSRIEMGRKEFHFRPGNLADVIRDTLNSYRYHFEKKGFLIHADIADNLPPMEFDSEAMAGVLINLLSNAIKFSPDRKEVTVRVFAEDGKAILQVEDSGIGIPVKERDKIFEKFYQVKNGAVAGSGGSGLGLPLVKHVAEAHGGEVRVEGEPGKGSIFSVIFPIERPARQG